MNDTRLVELSLRLAQESGALALHALLVELEALAAGREFVVAEILSHARRPEHARLRRAVERAIGDLGSIKLGQYLARWAGIDAAGLVLTAIGREGGAVVWKLDSQPARPAVAEAANLSSSITEEAAS